MMTTMAQVKGIDGLHNVCPLLVHYGGDAHNSNVTSGDASHVSLGNM